MSLQVGGRWCPQCEAEYRPGFRVCADCAVELVETDPRRGDDVVDHGTVEYDLGDWDDGRRDALRLLLVGRGIPQVWDGALLGVPRVREAEVDELIDELDAEAEAEAEATAHRDEDAEDDDGGFVVASASRRLVGALIDGCVVSSLTLLLGFGLAQGSSTQRLLAMAVTATYAVVPVARWGRTVGKLLVRTRVVREATLGIPSWPAATVRWAVPTLPAVVATLPPFAVGSILVLVSAVVVYAGVLWDDLGRGLHDRAAGTIVIRSR